MIWFGKKKIEIVPCEINSKSLRYTYLLSVKNKLFEDHIWSSIFFFFWVMLPKNNGACSDVNICCILRDTDFKLISSDWEQQNIFDGEP